VTSSCQPIDVFSLSVEEDVFYLDAMTLKPLKKGGWGGAKTCTKSSDPKVSAFVEQIRQIGRDRERIGSVEYCELKTEIDFLLLRELIAKRVLFLDRNTNRRIVLETNPMPVQFEWVYDEKRHAYVFTPLDKNPSHIFIRKPSPLIFDKDNGIFYPVASAMDQRPLTHLANLPPIKPEYTDYLSKQLKDKNVPEIEIPKSLIVARPKPIPVLTFMKRQESYQDYAVAELSFKYEDKECSHKSPFRKFERMKDGNLIHIERDLIAEETFMKTVLGEKMDSLRIKSYGYGYRYGPSHDTHEMDDAFVPKKVNTATTSVIKDTYWHKFLSTECPELKRHGVLIRFDDTFPYKPESEDDWYVDLEQSDMHWFDTEIGVMINGEKMNLLPILLTLIRSKDRTFLEGYKMDVPLRLEDGRKILVRRDRINQLLTFMRSIMKIGADDEVKVKIHSN